MAERTTEFLFFKKLAQKRLCMDSYYAELFATALTCQCTDDDGEGGDGDGIDNDEKVGVTSNDTNPSYLANKITNCGAIDLIVQNPGGDESLCIGHADTSQSPDIDTTGPQVIDTMIIDDYGHIVSWTLRNLTSGDILDEENLNNIFQDTPSIDFTVSGTTVTANVVLSQQPSNDLQILPDGLFYNDLKGENELVYGGVVTWLQDYDFHVSAAGYYINGIFYEAPEVYITLSPSDPTLDRIDVFYADINSTIQVLEGTPTEAAAQPGLDLGTQIGLGVVLVQAGSTEPVDIIEECIYQENSEWTTATNSPSTIDVASATTPCDGAVTVQATSAVTGNYVDFTRGTSFNVLATMNVVTMLIRPGAGWNSNAVSNHIILSFRLGGVLVKNQLIIDGLNELGLDISDPNCQIVSIPLSSFGLTPTDVVDGFRIEVVAGNSPFSFQVDGLCLQGNLNNSFTDDDIHNQYFGPQTPGRFWIKNNAKVEGWITSPDKVNNLGEAGGSEKFGWGSQAIGTASTAIGYLAIANGQEGSTAVGNQARADVGVAVGFGAYANRSVAVGGSSSGSGGTAVGPGASGTALSIVAVGGSATSSGISSISIGYAANTSAYGSLAIGSSAQSTHQYSAAVGVGAITTDQRQFVFGGNDQFTDFGYTSLYFGTGVTSEFNADRLWTITGSEGTNTAASILTIAGAKGTGTGNSGPISFQTSVPTISGTTLQSLSEKLGINSNTKGVFVTDSRFQEVEGSNIVAANDLTLGTGNAFTITGNTQVNAIIHTNWQDGATVKLHLTGTPTLKHNTAGGANTSPLRLAGAVDFTVSGYTVLELQLKDGYWNEVGRTVATGGGSGILTADNALNLSSATNVQWGGPLIIPVTTISFGTDEEVLWTRDANNYMSWYGDTAMWYWFAQFQEDYGKINISAGGFNYTITTYDSLVQSGQMDFDYAGNLTKTGNTTSITDIGIISLYSDSGGSDYTSVRLDNTALQNKLFIDTQSTNQYSYLLHAELGANSYFEMYSDTEVSLSSDIKIITDARFELAKGTNTAAANNLTLPFNGTVFEITGATQINAITTAHWQTGSVIYLKFASTPTVKHNTVGGGGTAPILLSGAADFVAAANDVLVLYLDGSTWIEVARTVATSGSTGILTADNGLTKNTSTNVQWGGSLLHDTTVDGDNLYYVLFTELNAFYVSTLSEAQIGSEGDVILTSNSLGSTASLTLNASGGGELNANGGILQISSANGILINNRFEEDKGIDVVAANDLTLGLDGNLFTITGNTQINAITTANWQAGSKLGMVFTGTPTLKHNTAGGAGTATMLLQGSADYTAAAGDYIEFRYDGTNWHETNRKIAASGSGATVTADNGLSKNTASNVQWGGLLIKDTYIEPASYNISMADGVIFDAGDSSCLAIGRNHSSEAGGGDLNFAFQNNQNLGGNENVAFGRNHIIRGNGNAAFGADSSHTSTANYAFICGDANNNRGIASFMMGFGNDNYCENGFTGGSDNDNGAVANANSNTFVYGLFNNVVGSRCFVGGENIDATGDNITAFGKNYAPSTANSFNVGFDASVDFEITDDKVRINAARFEEYKGVDVASANDLTLGTDGNTFLITGTTQINAITTANWQGGSRIFLIFNTALTVKHNTAGGGGTAPILLAGSSDLTTDTSTVLGLIYNGTAWEETSRKQAGGSGFVTADNGLTTSTPTNVQLFGSISTPATLLDDRYLSQGAFTLNMTGTNFVSAVVNVTNTSGFGGDAIIGTSQEGFGLRGNSLNNNGIEGHSNNAIGVYGIGAVGGVLGDAAGSGGGYGVYGRSSDGTTVGIAGRFEVNDNTTNNVAPNLLIVRTIDGNAAAAGIGSSIDYYTETTTGASEISNQIISKWSTATHASRTSQLDITGVNSGSTNTIMSAYGSGVVGIGISSSYTATRLNVVDNTVGAGSIVDISSTSTAAASNLQKGLNVSLSGANSNNNQITYGAYISNSHSGTGNTNYGIYTTITNDTSGSAALRAIATSGYGVLGESSTSYGVWGSSGSGFGTLGQSVDGYGAAAYSNPASTNTAAGVLYVSRGSSGTAADGIAGRIDFGVQNADASINIANQIISKWTTAAFATRTSELSLTGVNSAVTNTLLTISGAGIFTLTQGLSDYADDSAASAGGIPVNGLYRTGSAVKIRVS